MTGGVGTGGGRGGLNMGEIPSNDPEDLQNISDEGEAGEDEDGQRSFGSNNNNMDMGSDLEDDLQIKP